VRSDAFRFGVGDELVSLTKVGERAKVLQLKNIMHDCGFGVQECVGHAYLLDVCGLHGWHSKARVEFMWKLAEPAAAMGYGASASTKDIMADLLKVLDAGGCQQHPAPSLPYGLITDTRDLPFEEGSAYEGECDHEWVTWTGLHGTVTDCTRCRAVKV